MQILVDWPIYSRFEAEVCVLQAVTDPKTGGGQCMMVDYEIGPMMAQCWWEEGWVGDSTYEHCYEGLLQC
jgi:hypothetical protein